MEFTTKLNLKKPQIDDDIHDTITWLYENFDLIDNSHEETISDINSFLESGRMYNSGEKLWNLFPYISGFVGWANLRSGVFAPSWKSQTTYSTGDIVASEKNNGHYYQCVVGGTSGVSEPYFSPNSESITTDLNGASAWVANHNYDLNDIVIATSGDNSFYYKCIQAGLSGQNEPSWTNVSGTTIIDGNATWYAYKAVQWKESGSSCEFVPFGRLNAVAKYTQNVGDGVETSFDINHNLNTKDVVVRVRQSEEPYSFEDVEVVLLDNNNVNISFPSAPAVNEYRVIIMG